MIPEREMSMPSWLKPGPQHARPGRTHGRDRARDPHVAGPAHQHLQDARLPAVLCATGYYFWRRGIPGTIVVGMAVYLPLHIGWGW